MTPVKSGDKEAPAVSEWHRFWGRLAAAQGRRWSLRRRLIRLLSAGWVPPSVLSSRGFPLS